MPTMQSCRVVPSLQNVQRRLSVLRCADDSGAEVLQPRQECVPSSQGRDIGGCGKVRDHAGGDFRAIEKRGTDWPGRIFGVRPPEQGEVPLCWQEVIFAVRDGILAPSH